MRNDFSISNSWESCAADLRKDWAAVTAGLTWPYNSGAVEGNVNRIKMIKR
jgi:transposase